MPLGAEVGLGPVEIVLNKNPAAQLPRFSGRTPICGREHISAGVWPIATKFGTVTRTDVSAP